MQQQLPPSDAPSSPAPEVVAGSSATSLFEMSPGEPAAVARASSLTPSRKPSARRLDFDEAPPVSAASSSAGLLPSLQRQKSGDAFQSAGVASPARPRPPELAELEQRVAAAEARAAAAEAQSAAAAAQAADAAQRAAQAAARADAERAERLAERGRAEEERAELERELREARARRALAEEERAVAERELAGRDLLVAELRSRPASAELGRLQQSAKQADVVAFLSRELEHEKVCPKEEGKGRVL